MAIRLEDKFIPAAWQLAAVRVGRYEVIVYGYHGNMAEPCYTVMLNGQKVRCWTSADERTFPKKAAQAGHEIVTAIQRHAP